MEMEETVPESIAKRAHVKKHVEYPNKDESKVYNFTDDLSLKSFSNNGFVLFNASKLNGNLDQVIVVFLKLCVSY